MDISEKIFDLIGNIDANYNRLPINEKIKILNKLDEEWDKMPGEKHENEDKSALALFLFPEYILLSKLDKASKWLDILLMDRLNNPSQVGIYKGILSFEQKKYEESYRYFDMAYKDSQKRGFEGENPKYWDFYSNPQKYTNSKKKGNELPLDELTPKIKMKLDKLAEKGNQFEAQGQHEKAVQAWQEGLNLIPAPQQFFSETVWFLAAIGDVYFLQEKYKQAHECFDKARGNLSGEGYGNPFVMLRLGECCLEIGDEENALEYLLRAYMSEGKDIFDPGEDGEDSGMKYFEFLRTHIDLGEDSN